MKGRVERVDFYLQGDNIVGMQMSIDGSSAIKAGDVGKSGDTNKFVEYLPEDDFQFFGFRGSDSSADDFNL